MYIQRKRNGRRIMASEEAGEVFVEPEATDLLFETEDVADILAEATGEDVAVSSDPETEAVTFDVGGEQYEVTPEGDEEILESRNVRGRRVSASRRTGRVGRTVRASRRATSRPTRRVAASRREVARPAVRASRRLGRRNYR